MLYPFLDISPGLDSTSAQTQFIMSRAPLAHAEAGRLPTHLLSLDPLPTPVSLVFELTESSKLFYSEDACKMPGVLRGKRDNICLTLALPLPIPPRLFRSIPESCTTVILFPASLWSSDLEA